MAKDNGGEIKRNNLNDELTNYIGAEETDYTLSETAPFVVTYLDSGRSYIIDENGNVNEYVDIAQYVKVGDYVNYNPTISDKSGTQVEASKLTYISPTGSGTEHGNGYASTEEGGGQKFTATDSTKWRILSIEKGTVTLISEEPVKKDEKSQNNGNFVMYGAIGYLYAERELNEVCKIYGYGYGANTSQVTKYRYGGPLDEELIGEIKGSGARSITIEDINKQAGITEDDYITLNSNYGNTANPTINVYYPTMTIANGKSSSAGARNLEDTYYIYDKSKIENSDAQNMLFNGNYWLSSRCVSSGSNYGSFNVRNVYARGSDMNDFCYGYSSDMDEHVYDTYAIRPLVILKSNVIDTNTDYETEGHWNLK